MKSIKSDRLSSNIKIEKNDIIVKKLYDLNLEDEEGQLHNIILYKELKRDTNDMKKLDAFNRGD